MEHMTEAEALSDIYSGEEFCGSLVVFDKSLKMLQQYNDNKSTKTGEMIKCACCGKKIKKKSYQTQFCRNKGRGNCKDKYWNTVSCERRERLCNWK